MAYSLTPTSINKDFQNWLKGALAFLFAKEGLIGLVENEIIDFQKHLLQTLYTQKDITPGTTCSSCTTANVLACPTAGFCSKGRKCKAHDSKVPEKKPNIACPNGVCSRIRDAIKNEHRFKWPSWRNTDARRWCSDAFELSKCFMPPDGYSDKTSLADTDFNGILAVVINNTRFQRKMSVNLGLEPNICTQVRMAYREILHSADRLLSDQDLCKYIDGLITLLSDPAYLVTDVRAHEAVCKLKELQQNTLTIHANDITSVLNESLSGSINEHFREHALYSKEAMDKLFIEKKQELDRYKDQILDELSERSREFRGSYKKGTVPLDIIKVNTSTTSYPGTALFEVWKFFNELWRTGGKFAEQETVLHKDFSTKPKSIEYPISTKQEVASAAKVNVKVKKRTVQDHIEDRLWNKCLALDDAAYGYKAIRKNQLPSPIMLDDIVARFGRKSSLVFTICDLICSQIKSSSEHIVDVWPATKINDTHITFVIIVKEPGKDKIGVDIKKKKRVDTKEEKGVDVKKLTNYSFVKRTLHDVSDEGKQVLQSRDFDESLTQITSEETEKIRTCINRINRNMMEKHKHLTMISWSPLRSKGYGHQLYVLQREPCIVLSVLVKGYIPIQEDPFDRSYCDIPVDVREGFVTLFTETADSYHTALTNGCRISKSGIGTLGGFIDYPGFGVCGLTCAHVLLDSEQMRALSQSNGVMNWNFPTSDQYVYQPNNNLMEQSCEQRDHKAGKLVKAIYREGGNGNCGMDIAIFQVENRHPVSGCFPTPKDGRPSNMCFDTGETAGYSRLGFGAVTKFGASTDITDGTVLMDAPYLSIKSTYHNVEVLKDFTIILHNLLEVKSTSISPSGELLPFAMPGDSGALVFSKNKDDKLFCVGVLEGGTSNGTCFVMPISPILDELKLSSLKNFEKDKKLNHIEGQLTSLRNDMNHVTGMFENFCSNDFPNFQASMDQNVQQRLDNFTHLLVENQQRMEMFNHKLLETINKRLPAPATQATQENQNSNQ